MGVPGGAKEGPPKPKRPPRRPPSAGNEGPGPRAATEGEKAPSPEAVQGSAEAAEPMEEAPAERPKGREEPARAKEALRVNPLPVAKQTSEAGPDSTIEGPAAAEVAEGAQEGPPKEQLPRAPHSSDGDTGPENCVAGDGAAEPAPEAEAGSVGTPSTAPPARQGGKAARKTKHLLPTEGEEKSAAGGELPVAVAGQGTASGSIRGKRKAQARLPTCARKCTRLGLLVGVPGGAIEGPQKQKRPPRRPPSTGTATEGGKDPSPEAVQGSAETVEPMEEAPVERPKGREEPARAEIALRVDPLPISKETSEAGPDSTIGAGVAEGAQEGPPTEHLPRAPPSSEGDTGPDTCVAEEGVAEPAPEAEVGSTEPMQATPVEGPEGEEEPPQEQELPRAPEASMGSADNAEPMQETPAAGSEGEKQPPLPEQELPRAPEVGSADNAEPMQATPAEGPEGGKEPPQEQEQPQAPEASVGSADNAEPMQAASAEGSEGEKSPPTKNESCLRRPSLAATGGSALVMPRRGTRKHPLRKTRALQSLRLHWSPERGREGKSQRGQKVVP
ncbi:UNVERIFIED_CONTAM: hypothetical protein FKN15_008461 [Acipenser sinensis]